MEEEAQRLAGIFAEELAAWLAPTGLPPFAVTQIDAEPTRGSWGQGGALDALQQHMVLKRLVLVTRDEHVPRLGMRPNEPIIVTRLQLLGYEATCGRVAPVQEALDRYRAYDRAGVRRVLEADWDNSMKITEELVDEVLVAVQRDRAVLAALYTLAVARAAEREVWERTASVPVRVSALLAADETLTRAFDGMHETLAHLRSVVQKRGEEYKTS
jgi:hypothetical protein